ncbi:helitron_like_N domain-containing protein [Caerostris extrusa]|uniref:Helitron_like_N domain-containing protein n=1 Tax=Caerostris extrusa TaxID=172846 RepID=A0AAV4PJB6_CAEEX|nr:helitron_like_N domain-containing protein [Caerostris extrusa]
MYAKIESKRLRFLRFNQVKLRSEDYIHLQDAIIGNNAENLNTNNIANAFILPSSYIGSPRNMQEYIQDAMTYVRHYGQNITKDFKDVDTYFDLILCRVIPTSALYLPVLPYRCQGKLKFPLCRTCTENMQQTACTHSNEERSIIGTWVNKYFVYPIGHPEIITKDFKDEDSYFCYDANGRGKWTFSGPYGSNLALEVDSNAKENKIEKVTPEEACVARSTPPTRRWM